MRPIVNGGESGGGGHQMGKQSLVPAVQELWNAWEIHCMIVASLFLQVLLFLLGGLRRRCSGGISGWLLHTVLWLAYLSADSVAILVLGHLAVRASEPRHQLLPLWAPFVLVHLGGQDSISAYSKQDNELWRRHLLNLVTQVAVAAYVVARGTWPDGRLLAAMILMFLCGCLKYAERTLSLYSADPKQLRGWAESVLSMKLKGRQHERGKPDLTKAKGTPEEALEAMSATLQDLMMPKGCSCSSSALFWDAVTLVADIISVDAPLNQAQSITAADGLPDMLSKYVALEERTNAYQHVAAVLEYCYRRLYTKETLRLVFLRYFDPAHVVHTVGLLWALFPCVSTTVALALFMAAEKGGQLHVHASRVDIALSYLLLVGALVLDVSSAAKFTFSHLISSRHLPSCCKKFKQWSQELSQYNLITSAMNPIKAYFDLDTEHVTEHLPNIKKHILDILLVSGSSERQEWDIASARGMRALHWWMQSRRHEYPADSTRTTTLKALEETVMSSVESVDFPTSVLIWHIATDICYYHSGGGTNNDSDQVPKHKEEISRKLSNYILYLVFKCGVMLTTNSQIVHDHALVYIANTLSQRPGLQNNLGHKDAVMKLFEARQASTEEIQVQLVERIKNDNAAPSPNHDQLINNDNAAPSPNHIQKLKLRTQALKSSVVPRACEVAQKLISINDEADRWELIASMWAEMLLYAAPRCGGGFHYDHLNTGGEFVTHVLVLMYYLGPFLPPSDA